MKKILVFLSLMIAGVYYFGTAAFAAPATPRFHHPTILTWADCRFEGLTLYPMKSDILQSVLFVGRTGHAMPLVEDRGKVYLVDKGSIKPIAKIVVFLDNGVKLEGNLSQESKPTNEVKSSAAPSEGTYGPDGPRLLTAEDLPPSRVQDATK